jgi:type I restriction enzyme, R subunit
MAWHREIGFEGVMRDHLAAHGWLDAEGDAAVHDRACALFPADIAASAEATRPKA